MTESLFERLGGQNAVNTAVDIFYRKMLMDDRVNYFLMTWIWSNKSLSKKDF